MEVKLGMSMGSGWSTLGERVTGKWQIPLFVFSVVLLGVVFLRPKPGPTHLPIKQAVEYLDSLVSSELYDRAIEIGDQLLASPDHAGAQMGSVHLRLARARYGRSRAARSQTGVVGDQVVEHYRQAASSGEVLDGRDFKQMGGGLEWQGRIAAALQRYEEAIAHGVEEASDLRKRMLWLMRNRLHTPPKVLNTALDTYLTEIEGHRLDLRVWAIEQKLRVLEDLDRLGEAATLLARNAESFRESDLSGRFVYLEALLLYKTGHVGDAETLLRALRNRIDQWDDVHAMSGWLLGRVLMDERGPRRPLEALSFFSDVVNYHSQGPYALASRVGQAEAQAVLERHEEAVNTYVVAIEKLPGEAVGDLVDRNVLRISLGVLAEAQRKNGQFRAAVAYARLAASLADPADAEQTGVFLQQLVRLQVLLAEELNSQLLEEPDGQESQTPAGEEEVRALFAEAAHGYIQLAKLNPFNERSSSEASWQAADLYARAGRAQRAAELFETFARERPSDPLVPRALLRVGQLRQASGQLEGAIEAFQECYRRFPRSLDSARALVPLAQCYLALGPESAELVEKTLRVVLEESEVFTPQAPEFADALFLLGELQNRTMAYERAISTLEEALERYPQDPRVWRTRFLLADAYRNSGLALKRELLQARRAGEQERMRRESAARLVKAGEFYRMLIAEYEVRNPSDLDRMERLHLRHAALYEADCFFEQRQYQTALKLYEEAAATFRQTPTILAAYVQIVNCHTFLGRPAEARAALARATILVDAVPEDAFDRAVEPRTRKDWKQYFEWLRQSELF